MMFLDKDEFNVELFTFSEWNNLGRHIHCGVQSRGNRNGEALFDIEGMYDPNDNTWVMTSARLGLREPGEWSDMPH